MHLILASQSPRRREILGYFSLPFEAIASNFNEESITFQGNPETYAQTLANEKALVLCNQYPNAAILAADTIVYRHGKVYGKPKSEEEAVTTLLELSGQWHSVYTGITLHYQNESYCKTEETRVLFNSLTPQQIKNYHDKLNLYDKAGSYQLQSAGGLIVNKIDGCYYNVIGMPINSVRSVLKNIGIELWDYLQH